MEGLSKIVNVEAKGTWESKYGVMYSFEYTFEDETVIKASHKEDKPMEVGQEAQYTVKKDNQYGKQGVVGKYNPSFKGVGMASKSVLTDKGLLLSSAMKSACMLLSGRNPNPITVKEKTVEIYQILKELDNELN